MRIAQQLYEGVDVKGNGTVGLITYLRTDSTRVSDEAKSAAVDFISQNYGEDYLQEGAAKAKANGTKVQDAHEGDPSFRYHKTAVRDQGLLIQRPVPSLPVDLEAFCGKPDEQCCL